MKYLALIFMLSALTPTLVQAQIMPSSRVVESCVFIDNLADFPDYTAVLKIAHYSPRYYEGLSMGDKPTCTDWLFEDFLAIKNVDLDQIEQYEFQAPPYAVATILNALVSQSANRDLSVTSNDLGLDKLAVGTEVPTEYPLKSRTYTYHIDALTDDAFELHLVSTMIEDTDGSKLVYPVETPKPEALPAPTVVLEDEVHILPDTDTLLYGALIAFVISSGIFVVSRLKR